MIDYESCCVFGKKYPRAEKQKSADYTADMEKTVLTSGLKICEYVKIENGSLVCFVYGHIDKFKNEKDYHYNLYRLDPDGEVSFLSAGTRGGIETLYVEDNFAYWDDFGKQYRVSIFNGLAEKYNEDNGWEPWDFETGTSM
ncbi:MAG: hypothetical protein K5871_08855 [Lachnospiraceae bacterium]|nr:hypothetical protein [Lachnospiraceae bacterium]